MACTLLTCQEQNTKRKGGGCSILKGTQGSHCVSACTILNEIKLAVQDVVKTIAKSGTWAVYMCVSTFSYNYMSLKKDVNQVVNIGNLGKSGRGGWRGKILWSFLKSIQGESMHDVILFLLHGMDTGVCVCICINELYKDIQQMLIVDKMTGI